MPENPKKKLEKNPADKVMSPEQALINATITQASATMSIAESIADIKDCILDMADNMEIVRLIEVKRAAGDGLLTPEEIKEWETVEDDEDGDGEPEK
jgi:hypothetical protein